MPAYGHKKTEFEGLSLKIWSRENRKNQTPQEKALWERLRARGFKGLKFRRQHAVGPYIADFYCSAKRLLVEVDGAGHFTEEGKVLDQIRDGELKLRGFKIVRITNSQVDQGIENALRILGEAL